MEFRLPLQYQCADVLLARLPCGAVRQSEAALGYDGELERDSLIDIDDENAGMEILMQYPEAFVKAAHKFLSEQEGEECGEAIYGVGGYFYWGEDDELEEEFFVEEITM